MEMWCALLGSLVALICYTWRTTVTVRHWPPGPKGLPVLGNWEVFERHPRTLRDLSAAYGGVVSLFFFQLYCVVINDWASIKEAFVDQQHVFSGRPRVFLTEKTAKKNDVVSIDGPGWKEKRRIMIHHLRNVGFGKTTMEPVIAHEITKLFGVLQMSCSKDVKISGLFFLPILNILYSFVAGTTFSYDDHRITHLEKLIRSCMDLLCQAMPLNALPVLRFVPGDPFGYHKLVHDTEEIHEFLDEEVDRHIKEFKPENEARDFIDAYLAEIHLKKDSPELKNQDHPYKRDHLLGTVLDLIMAGVDTSTITLEWGILYMALWPEIQRRIQDELDSVIGRHRLPTYTDISRLPYTEATLLEIHRYASILPLSVPHRTMATTSLAKYTIPENAIVVPNIWAVHNDKSLWGDPEVFRPERFLSSAWKVERPEYLIPFSVGARSCPGTSLARMQLFLFFSNLLHRFNFKCITGQPPPTLIPETLKSLTVVPKPYHLFVDER